MKKREPTEEEDINPIETKRVKKENSPQASFDSEWESFQAEIAQAGTANGEAKAQIVSSNYVEGGSKEDPERGNDYKEKEELQEEEHDEVANKLQDELDQQNSLYDRVRVLKEKRDKLKESTKSQSPPNQQVQQEENQPDSDSNSEEDEEEEDDDDLLWKRKNGKSNSQR